jgi:hypothetical protein
MKTMYRTTWVFSLGTLLLVWALANSSAAQTPPPAQTPPAAPPAVTNTPPGVAALAAPLAVTLGEATRGVVFYTAAINSDGSIASCFECNPMGTQRLAVGIYQVNFFVDVEAINGWSRWVQPDTLTTGTTNAYCTTADRAGVPTAIWVQCQAPGSMGQSVPVDTSFFLFVAR